VQGREGAHYSAKQKKRGGDLGRLDIPRAWGGPLRGRKNTNEQDKAQLWTFGTKVTNPQNQVLKTTTDENRLTTLRLQQAQTKNFRKKVEGEQSFGKTKNTTPTQQTYNTSRGTQTGI